MKISNLSLQLTPNTPYFFKDLFLDLEERRLHALHGKNGVGKSILLHLLGRKLPTGAVIQGEILADNAVLMSQHFNQILVPSFTFFENLEFAMLKKFPLPFGRLRFKKDTYFPHVQPLIEKFQIDPNLPISSLSGGQRQILALLMQLQRPVKILLLDEPTAALDEDNARMVFEFLSSLEGLTLLIVCHDTALIHDYTTGKHLHLKRDAVGLRSLILRGN